MSFSSFKKTVVIFTLALSLNACAHTAQLANCDNEEDPYEPLNRQLFAFHNWFDDHFFRPIALSYRAVVPTAIRKSVNNVFANTDEIPITVNNVLQGEWGRAGASTRRLLINTTIGIAGIFDVATEMGYERERSDLGQTLYRWGWTDSSYLFIPIFGPSTIRDGSGALVDLYMTPWPYLGPEISWGSYGLFAVNQRAKFVDTETLLSVAALDEYTFIRDGFLANRKVFMENNPIIDPDDTQEDWGDIL